MTFTISTKPQNADNAEKADKAGKADKAEDKNRGEKLSDPRARKLTIVGVERFNNADSLITLLTIARKNKKKRKKYLKENQRRTEAKAVRNDSCRRHPFRHPQIYWIILLLSPQSIN